jgi:glycerol-3-phosphate O-acyltransferase
MTLNSCKLHQSRVMLAVKPEISITYLLEAFRQLPKVNMHIVPVLITYDRVLEVGKIS